MGIQSETILTNGNSHSVAQLEKCCSSEERLICSFNTDDQTLIPSPSGFFLGAVEAYNLHHHLQLRPEDIWFAILSQLSLYINLHAEEVRGKFFAHKEREESAVVVSSATSRQSVDFGQLAAAMINIVDLNAVDPGLKVWVMPAFSTTTIEDKVVASVLITRSLHEYVGSSSVMECGLPCGIPSVILLGERADWEEMTFISL